MGSFPDSAFHLNGRRDAPYQSRPPYQGDFRGKGTTVTLVCPHPGNSFPLTPTSTCIFHASSVERQTSEWPLFSDSTPGVDFFWPPIK